MLDLFGHDFVLLTGTEGAAWSEAAEACAQRFGIVLATYRVGSDVLDIDGCFGSRYGLSASGAALVRPDGFIAWRAHEASQQPVQELSQVLTQVLCRKLP